MAAGAGFGLERAGGCEGEEGDGGENRCGELFLEKFVGFEGTFGLGGSGGTDLHGGCGWGDCFW